MNLASFSVPKMSASYLPFVSWFPHYSQLSHRNSRSVNYSGTIGWACFRSSLGWFQCHAQGTVAPALCSPLRTRRKGTDGAGLQRAAFTSCAQSRRGRSPETLGFCRRDPGAAGESPLHCFWHHGISSPWHTKNSSLKHASRKKLHFLRNGAFFCVWIFFFYVGLILCFHKHFHQHGELL